MAPDAYLDGLKMLARRELSEGQVRQRLIRRGHNPQAVDEAVARLKEEDAIDDARVAASIARTEAILKRHGKLRVQRQLESAGVGSTAARRAVEDVFSAVDEEALLNAALAKRLRGRTSIADEAEFARLFRSLVAQGFEPDRILKALEASRRRTEEVP